MAIMDSALYWLHTAGITLAQAAPAAAPARSPGKDIQPLIFMFGALAVVYIFMVLRPQRTEQKKRQSMLDQVAKGDSVVTIGGLHGKVESIDISKGIIAIEVAPKTVVRVNKSALASVTPKGKAGQDKDETDGKGDAKGNGKGDAKAEAKAEKGK